MRIVWSQLFSKPNLMTLASVRFPPLMIDHFISEIADCTQQKETHPHCRPTAPNRHPLSRLERTALRIPAFFLPIHNKIP